MKRRGGFFPVFFVVILLSIIILFLSLSGNLKFLTSFLGKGTSGIQTVTFEIFQNLPLISTDSKIKKLQNEKLELISRVANFEKIKRDNLALSDQFRTPYPSSHNLLEAKIIGAPAFVPGISSPSIFILNKGAKDNLKKGQAVVFKDNLVGVISQVSEDLSKVNTVKNVSLSFTAKTQRGAVGVVRGGASLTLDNVMLSENIKADELVVTYGDIDFEGVYVPPDLVVGKIASVKKNASDLFQKAEIESFVDLSKLSTVFVFVNTK